MKDYKYALEIIRQEIERPYICPEVKYAFEASIEALMKQIPKRPIIESWSPAKCPGQKLKWDDDAPYSQEDYNKAKLQGLDLDDWGDYVEFYELGEREEYE